jgi:8-hydroxy-5-deazaflavin:NADPH oxidoreductase
MFYTSRSVWSANAATGASEVAAALAPGARIVKAFNPIVTARFNEGP